MAFRGAVFSDALADPSCIDTNRCLEYNKTRAATRFSIGPAPRFEFDTTAYAYCDPLLLECIARVPRADLEQARMTVELVSSCFALLNRLFALPRGCDPTAIIQLAKRILGYIDSPDYIVFQVSSQSTSPKEAIVSTLHCLVAAFEREGELPPEAFMLAFDYEEATMRPPPKDPIEFFLERCTETVTYEPSRQGEPCSLSIWCGETHKEVNFVGLFGKSGLTAEQKKEIRAVLTG